MQHTGADWVTNNPEIACRLRAADHRYDVAVVKARRLPLAEKVEALRAAMRRRLAEYIAIGREQS